MAKVTIVGAGNVGATAAHLIALKNLANVVLVDVVEGLARGKALDIMQSAAIEGFSVSVVGSEDYGLVDGSDIVVITAGVPRRPGMTREELLSTNASIVKDVVEHISSRCPNAIIIVVTNPLDAMSYLAYKVSGFPRERVMGMAGVLDAARFSYFIGEKLGVHPSGVNPCVLGSHGEAMVPIARFTTVYGVPLSKFLKDEEMEDLEERTRKGGAEIVSLLKKGSAFYAPASSIVHMVKSILLDEKKLLYASVYLEGEYGFKDVFMGVPVVLGKGGVEKVVELELEERERRRLEDAYTSIKSLIDRLEL